MSKGDEEMSGWQAFGIFVLGCASVPFHYFVFVKLWTWFIVPLGLPTIGYWHAFGLGTFHLLIRSYRIDNKNDGYSKRERDYYKLAIAWMAPIFAVVLGALAHSFM